MSENMALKINEIKENVENNLDLWTNVRIIKTEYKNKGYILHLMDGEGYKYCVNYNVVRNASRRNAQLNKFFRNNVYTRDNIINYLKILNKKFILISKELNNAKEKLVWDCFIHGEFKTSWNEIKNGHGCPDCGKIKAAQTRRNSIEYVKSKFEENNLVLMTEEYTNNESPLPYVCNKHKPQGIQHITFGNLITGGGCNYCSKERYLQKITKSHDQFLSEVKNVHGDKYVVIGRYTGSRDNILIFCNKCKENFTIAPHHLTAGHGCGRCTKSLGEEIIKYIFLKRGISFAQQYTFKDCVGIKRKLPFDFAVLNGSDIKCLIEFNGVQHYKAVDKFGGEEQLKKQQHYDNIKLNYCKNNGIKLIVIPYWEIKNIENILKENGII